MTEEHTGQTDPADTFGRALNAQQDQIRGLESTVLAVQNQLQGVAAQLNQLTGLLSASAQPAASAQPDPAPGPAPADSFSPVPETFSPSPEKFSGDSVDCSGFLFQCSLALNRSPRSFPHDDSKIAFILRLLTGRALRWAESRFPDCRRFRCSFSEFITEFKMVFAAESDETTDSRRLLALRQRGKRVADFAIEFRTLAAAAGWEERALKTVFFQALDEPLKDELARLEVPASLNEFISLAVRLDNRLRGRFRGRAERSLPSSPPDPIPGRPAARPPSPPEPMQLGRLRLTPEERQQRIAAKLCIYCASPNHFIGDCPERSKDRVRRL